MYITHQDAQLFTVSFGSGPHTIVALGGWAGSWELWTGPFGTLSKTWRTVAFDHRGSGVTIAPVDSITPETLVQDIFAVLNALNIERCVLAAESAGAALAMLAVLQQPQRFDGLVIVDGNYYWPMPDTETSFARNLRQDFAATCAAFVQACTPEPDSTALQYWGRQILARAGQAAAVRLYECIMGVDLREQVNQIAQPTLILHGEQDAIVEVAAAEWLASQMPHAELVILKDTGHVPTITRPQRVADEIDRFFRV